MALMVTVIEESSEWERMLYGEIDWSETREETGIGVAAVVTFGGDRIPQVISNHSDPLTENLLHRWVTVSGKHRYGDTTVFNFLSHDHLRFCVKQRLLCITGVGKVITTKVLIVDLRFAVKENVIFHCTAAFLQ
ncbi:unnamed protein product [Gadus morhua 'NCC']